ncbi:MAG: DUF5916 domain-containing protein [Candidatus Omnitrophota bacterium]
MFKYYLTLLSIILFNTLIFGVTPEPKRIYMSHQLKAAPPSIDGKLDDPAWSDIPWENKFIQREPYEGQSPSQETAFKIVYDEKNLYVGIRAYDTEPDKIVRRLSRRDGLEGDWMTIQIDSYHDLRTAFVFAVNAEGVKYDKILTEDGSNENTSWDPVWYVKISVDDKGWIAEMKIPFSQLRFSNANDQVWGMQISRYLFRKLERSDWQFIPKDASGYVHMFGELSGIKNIKHKRQIELLPYAVGQIQSFPKQDGNPFATGNSEKKGAIGLDGKIGLNSDLTLDFTINPDFGQVEADPSTVNLTTYETFYQEKRPFFIEGKNILNFQLMGGDGDFSMDNLFYSRRIGRFPHYTPYVDEHEYINMPIYTSILGAFKLTGKTRSGLSIGILESLTSREQAEIDFMGNRRFEGVEPFTNYFLARLQKDYNQGQTVIGGMMTAVNRNLKDSDPDLQYLHQSAYTGGLDLFHSWKDKTYAITLVTAFSTVQGSKESILNTQLSPVHYYQRPDVTHVSVDPNRTSLSGHGGRLEFSRTGNGHFNYSAGVTWRSPGLELNDMGYLRISDRIMQWVWVGYRIWKPFSIFRSINVNFNQWLGWDFGGNQTDTGGNTSIQAEFKNYWSLHLGINPQFYVISTTGLRGGPALRLPPAISYWAEIGTDSRKPFVLEIGTSQFVTQNHAVKSSEVWAEMNYRPSSSLSLSFTPSYSRNQEMLQYVDTQNFIGTPRYILGTIHQKTVSLTVRLNYSITPDLSIEYYGQPFISAGKYADFKRITSPRDRTFENRFQLFTPEQISFNASDNTYSIDENLDHRPDYSFCNPNYNFLEFRSNLVMRWEYVPGSTVYLVWSQGRTGLGYSGDFSFNHDWSDLFRVKPYNVFLIKFTYLFNL